jgi:hypothetical protein
MKSSLVQVVRKRELFLAPFKCKLASINLAKTDKKIQGASW